MMTGWESSELTMNAWSDSVRQFYIEGFERHYKDLREASSQDLELWEFLETQGVETQDDIVTELFLNNNDLGRMKDPKNRVGIPEAVLGAYDFYQGGNCQVIVARILVQERDTYAVRAGTTGESGWLEIFDEQNKLLGSATTLCDVVGWDAQFIVRERFRLRGNLSDWESAHWYRLKALSTVYPPRQRSTEKTEQREWSVRLESCPPESFIEVMKLLRRISGLALADAKRKVESLPQLVTKPLSKEEASSVQKQFKEVGAQASIQHRQWSINS